MDLSEALVDLLLVRLGREEEKQRVLDLLVSELQMGREAARRAVDSAPVVLLESVPMGQARVIQNRLYPFIDLLPRMDSVPEERPAPDARAEEREPEEEEEIQEPPARAREVISPAPPQQAARTDEKLVVTSASEEVLMVERCHVCGRTPTSGDRLAPCRSCAELTCRDCFDRVAHVCQKCSAEGKVVDSPLGRPNGSRPQQRHAGDAGREPEARASRRTIPPALAVALPLAVLAAAFLALDPLDLIGPDGGPPADTAAVDTTPSDSLPADTVSTTASDTLARDTLRDGSAPSLSDLVLPEGVDPLLEAPPVPLELEMPPGLAPLPGETELLAPDLARIAAAVPVEIDRFALVRLPDSTTVAAVSILHPEEDTRRYALLRYLGEWLGPSGIDELVFYYSESEYYPVRTVSFVGPRFGELSDCMGPTDFQACAGSSGEEVWAVLTGSLQTWMARY